MASALFTAAVAGLLGAVCGPTQMLEVGPRPAGARFGALTASRGDPQVLGLLRAQLVEQLPPGWRLGGLRLTQPLPRELAGAGPLRVRTTLPAALAAGSNRIEVQVGRGVGQPARIAAEITLWPAPGVAGAKPAPVVTRNQEVMVVVRYGNVTVQSKGVTQQAAALGERVAVLPNGSTRTVQGTVRDDKTVEVAL